MGENTEKDPAAQAMAKKRWDKTSKKKRSEVGSALAKARWAGKDKKAAKKKAAAR
jgi:hypothetical protein